jgi:phosphoribosyl-ATP pyrophosphohydrolase/phosphoribosyl-AMP cyclohydrolase
MTRSIDWDKVGEKTEISQALLPVVVQQQVTGEVLMVGYMNPEALAETERTGWVTFFSRKDRALRVQGENRGCRLRVWQYFIGCEENSLVLKVRREVGADPDDTCHHGGVSCLVESEMAD